MSSALSAPLVDRVQPRLVSMGSDLLAAALVGLIPTLALVGALPLWALVLIVAAQGLTRAPGSTAEDALLPSAAKLAGTPISRASSWQEGAARLIVMAAGPTLPVLFVTIAVTSFAFGAINPILLSQLFARVPEMMRGRVFGVVSAGALAGTPVGALAGGAMVELLGLTPALLLSAALCLAVTLCPFVFPVWRRLDEKAPVGDESSGNHVGGAAA